MSYAGTKRLLEEKPEWLPILRECVKCAEKYGEFAGSWVLKGVERELKKKVWVPGLRTLVAYGILKKVDTSRGGRRAYYIIPDIEGTKKALQELNNNSKTHNENR